MRYLGVDYGSRRIGLAISDPEGRIAFPDGVVGSVEEVARAVRDKEISAIVVGLPLTAEGRSGDAAEAARAFAERLIRAVESQRGEGAEQIPVYFENEILTSRLAERSSPSDRADAAAAALILQSYLDRQAS